MPFRVQKEGEHVKVNEALLAHAVRVLSLDKRLRDIAETFPCSSKLEKLPPYLKLFPPREIISHLHMLSYLETQESATLLKQLGKSYPFVNQLDRQIGFIDLLIKLGIRGTHEELVSYFTVFLYVKTLKYGLSPEESIKDDPDELALWEEINIRIATDQTSTPPLDSLSRTFVRDMLGARCHELCKESIETSTIYEMLVYLAAHSCLSREYIERPLKRDDLKAIAIAAQALLSPQCSTVNKAINKSIAQEAQDLKRTLSIGTSIQTLCHAFKEARDFALEEHEALAELKEELQKVKKALSLQEKSAVKPWRYLAATKQSQLNALQLTCDKLQRELVEARAEIASARELLELRKTLMPNGTKKNQK